jgi:hypothetical protein
VLVSVGFEAEAGVLKDNDAVVEWLPFPNWFALGVMEDGVGVLGSSVGKYLKELIISIESYKR